MGHQSRGEAGGNGRGDGESARGEQLGCGVSFFSFLISYLGLVLTF